MGMPTVSDLKFRCLLQEPEKSSVRRSKVGGQYTEPKDSPRRGGNLGLRSDSFKKLDKLTFLRKGGPLPDGLTCEFNRKRCNVASGQTECGQTTLANWFSCTRRLPLDEEVISLGSYGFTLTVLSSDELAGDPDDEDLAEEEALIESWTPRFAVGGKVRTLAYFRLKLRILGSF